MASKSSKQGKARRQAARTRATRDRRANGGSRAASPIDKAARKERLGKVAIAAFAVIMALSMVLPSLASIFSGSTAASSDEAASEASDDTGSAASVTTVADVDAQYQALVDELEADLEENEDDLADILNLGNDYLQWAYQASFYASTDEEKAHVGDLYDQAISYYDRYLDLNDAKSVHVDRALAQYYSGDSEAAISYLADYTAGDGADYGPAWANLGMMYQYTGDSDSATSCYDKAMEVDPDDETGAYSYASSMLSSMSSSSDDSTTTSSSATASSTSSSSSSGTSLSDTLASSSGTSF